MMNPAIKEELATYELPEKLRFVEHDSGLVVGQIDTPKCKASVFLLGAHVAEFQPVGQQPLLFMSQSSNYGLGSPIRGGVPICFPWFGPKKHEDGGIDSSAPSHGLVRTQPWSVIETADINGDVTLILGLDCPPFSLRYSLCFGSTLDVELTVENRSEEPQSYEVALHTYFQIQDLSQVEIGGVSHLPHLDQLTGQVIPPALEAEQAPIRFTEETDRIYQGDCTHVAISDPAAQRCIHLQPRQSRSTVVWNPWIAKAARMPDFGDQEYLQMCCVETANIGENRTRLGPQESSTIGYELSVESP